MFALLGLSEVLALLVIGGISAPLFLRPARRGGPVLIPREFDVRMDTGVAVSIQGQHVGLIALVLKLVRIDLTTTFQATEEKITYRVPGVWHPQGAVIPISQVSCARDRTSQPLWHLSAIGVIVMLLTIFAGAGRMTLQQFGAGMIAAGLCGIGCTLERTVDLIVETTGGLTIVLPFRTWGRNAITVEDVRRAADRITDLARQARSRS